MNRLIKTAMFAVAGVALIAQSASAAQTYATGDLLLGVREANATSGNDLIVDLGPSTTFLNATGPISLDSLTLYNSTYPTLQALITHVFGGPQGDGTDPVMWSVMGQTIPGASIQNLYTTDPSGNTAALSQGTLSQDSSDFGGSVTLYRGAAGAQVLVANHAVQRLNSGASSYSGEIAAIDGLNGFTAQTAIPTTGTASSGLYTFSGGNTGTLDGTFSVDSTGAFTFTPVAVPEPGTYGIIAGAGLLVLVLRRRFNPNQV